MAAPYDPMIVAYDSDNDILRVFVEPPREDAVAVPGDRGITMLVTDELDRPIGVVIERFVGRENPKSNRREREEVFEGYRDVVESFVPRLIRSFGPLAKDRAAAWLEAAGHY